MRAYVEGAAPWGLWVGLSLDLAKRHPDPAERAKARRLRRAVTPVVKALLTDLGFEVANLGMQVFGGHGYIREHGMEQYVRDARIAQIYEGTNGVQALDLVGRKLPAHAAALRTVFHPIADFIEARSADKTLAEFVEPLAEAFVQGCSRRPPRSPVRDGQARGGRCRGQRLPAPVRAWWPAGLPVGAHGRDRRGQGRRGGRRSTATR